MVQPEQERARLLVRAVERARMVRVEQRRRPVWHGDVPNKRCVRVREGGEVLQTIDLDRGCFACMLGGAGGRTLFMMAADWRGPGSLAGGARTGQVLTVEAPAAGAGWPARGTTPAPDRPSA